MSTQEPTRNLERRYATALFIDITGFTTLNERLDPEESYAIVQGLLRALAGVVERHGGSVNQTVGDCIFALFGVPTAIENAAHAAVNAAVEMHTSIHEYNRANGIDPPLDVHTGINTGLIVVGSSFAQDISVMGDAVNVAARLKDLAPSGKIWIGQQTHSAVSQDFEFRALEAIPLKGKEERIRIYEVTSRDLAIHRPSRQVGPGVSRHLVGRGRELDRLRERVADLRKGSGGVVSVVGDAGVGKSRLVAELADSPDASEVLWLEARSLATGANRAFHPFADFLRSWIGGSDDASGSDLFARIEAAVDPLHEKAADEILPFVASLMGLRLSGRHRERVNDVQGEALQNLTTRAMNQLLHGLAAQGPVVLHFDDLHWADVSSVDLLVALLRVVADRPVLFLLSTRPEPEEARERLSAAASRLEDARYEEITLQPLDHAATEELLETLFAQGALPPAARRVIEEKTGGNPFYIGEVIRSLLDEGAVERSGDTLLVTSKFDEVSIPATVGEVIQSRVDRLPDRSRAVLQLATIFGRAADQRILSRIDEGGDLGGELDLLTEANLLVARERFGRIVYEVAHPVIQETVYAAAARQRRREVHGRIADAIEEIYREGDPGYHALLAYHYGRAGDVENAEHHLLEACDEGGVSAEALQFLEETAQLFLRMRGDEADPDRTVLTHAKLAIAYLNRGMMIEGNRHIDRALALRNVRRSTGRAGRVLRFGLAVLRVARDLYLVRDPTRRRPATEQEREVMGLSFRGAQAQVTADPVGFVFDSMDGLSRLGLVDPGSVEWAGRIYAGSVGYLAFAGAPIDIAERLLRRAERFVDSDDPREYFFFRVFSFVHRVLSGDWDERHAIDPDLVEENLRLGELWYVINYLPLDAKRRAHQGRFDEAGEQLQQIEKIAELYAYDLARSNAFAVRMFLQMERRQLRAALETSRAYYRNFDEDLLNLYASSNRARIEVLLGDLGAAEDTLERASGVLQRISHVPPFHSSAYWIARAAVALANLKAARVAGQRAPRQLRREAVRAASKARRLAARVAWERPEALALSGHVAWELGRRRRALRMWSAALDEAERLGMRPQVGRIWRDAGIALQEEGAGRKLRDRDAAGCFAEATQVLKPLGLSRDLEEIPVLGDESESQEQVT